MFRLLHAPSISKKVSPFYCYTETITFCCIYIYCIQLSIYCCLFILFLFVDWNGIRRSGNTIRFHVDWNETANQVLPWYYTSISVYILWLSLSWDGDGLVFFFPRIILKKSIHISHTIGQQSLLFIFWYFCLFSIELNCETLCCCMCYVPSIMNMGKVLS